MSKLILVDTDILIDGGRKVNKAVACLERYENEAILGISIITQMELMVGCRNKTELRILDRFLRRFEIISLNESIADTAISLLQHYRLSHGLLIADALIAATTLTIEVPLLTKNQKDYKFIKGLQLATY